MITVTCDMCGEKINSPFDEVILDLRTDDDTYSIIGKGFKPVRRQLCVSCATRLVIWIDNKKNELEEIKKLK